MNALTEDGAGGIWCGTDRGLYHLERVKGRWILRFVDTGMPQARYGDSMIEALLRDHCGNLWIGGHRALYVRSAASKCERFPIGTKPEYHILSLLEDHQGRIWVGTWWEGLFRIRVKSATSELLIEKIFTRENGLAGNLIHALLECSDGHLWAGTGAGVSRFVSQSENEHFEKFTTANGVSENEARALAEDSAGNVWVGSTGAQKISRGGFVTYGKQDGLASNYLKSIFEDRAGELCVVTRISTRAYVNRFDGRRFHPVVPNIPDRIKDWGWGDRQLTFQDHAGKWWVPTSEGLFRFEAPSLAQLRSTRPEALYSAKDGLPGSVFVMFEDSRGDVWVSTAEHGNAVARWDRASGTLHPYSAADGIAAGRLAWAFAEDRGGNIWIGFEGALARYCHGQFQFFEAPEAIGRFGTVRTLHPDQEGRLWAGCRNGLVRIDSPDAVTPNFTALTTADGLSSNDVQCVVADRWGRIYVGTGRGVDCFYPRTPLRMKYYTKADGLALGDTMAAFRDRQGALWFGTPVGLSRLEPEPEPSGQAPRIFITRLRAGGVPRPVSAMGETALSGPEVAPDKNQIAIEFVGLGFGTGEMLQYQYRLEPADKEWSPPTNERRIDYASLSPAHYRFLVRAITTDGLVSAKPATVEFTVLAPVWQRWWARTLLVMFLGAILYGLYRYRVSRLLELERLRTRIATDLHDDIGSTLSQIAILSEIASRQLPPGEQVASFSEIADLSRESVDTISDIVWAIDPDRDHLEDLWHRMRRFASDLFSSNGVRLQFRGPEEERNPEIEPELRRQIFLIFKEALHNTARHAGCSEVQIEMRIERGWLLLGLHDNGKGFDAGQVVRGHGLASMRQRAGELGGEIRIESVCGLGTTIRLRVLVDGHTTSGAKRTYTKG